MMNNQKKCDQCGSIMEKDIISKEFEFQGKVLELKGIEASVCKKCGNIIYGFQELMMIESLIQSLNDSDITILDLSETAKLLKVSNQTIYNMIKEGKIKAYKVGREWRFLPNDIKAYLTGNSNREHISLAAKGGNVNKEDISKIITEVFKED